MARGLEFRLELVSGLDLECHIPARNRDRDASADVPVIVDLVGIANAQCALASILTISRTDPGFARSQKRKRRNSHSCCNAFISSFLDFPNLIIQTSNFIVDAADLLVESLLCVIELATIDGIGA